MQKSTLHLFMLKTIEKKQSIPEQHNVLTIVQKFLWMWNIPMLWNPGPNPSLNHRWKTVARLVRSKHGLVCSWVSIYILLGGPSAATPQSWVTPMHSVVSERKSGQNPQNRLSLTINWIVEIDIEMSKVPRDNLGFFQRHSISPQQQPKVSLARRTTIWYFTALRC